MTELFLWSVTGVCVCRASAKRCELFVALSRCGGLAHVCVCELRVGTAMGHREPAQPQPELGLREWAACRRTNFFSLITDQHQWDHTPCLLAPKKHRAEGGEDAWEKVRVGKTRDLFFLSSSERLVVCFLLGCCGLRGVYWSLRGARLGDVALYAHGFSSQILKLVWNWA